MNSLLEPTDLLDRPLPKLGHCSEDRDFFTQHQEDKKTLFAYLLFVKEASNQKNYEAGCRLAISYALSEQHEERGNETLACKLLAESVFRGFGVKEAHEMIERLEQRKEEADLLAYLTASVNNSYSNHHDDPELDGNIDLLKKALLQKEIS